MKYEVLFDSRVMFSSSVVLFLPIMIETERMGIEEAQKQQQRQILLGPGAAMSAGANAPLPPMHWNVSELNWVRML